MRPKSREETSGIRIRTKIRKDRHRGNISSGALPRIFFCTTRRGSEAEASVRRTRIPFDRPALFEECVSEVRDADGEQSCLLFLGSKPDKIDKAFGHSRYQVGNIDRLLPLNVLLNQVIDFTVQAVLR